MSNKYAYPVSPEIWATHDDFCGMTLRDHFAGLALSSVMATAQNLGESTPEERAYMFGQIAGWMYEMADAMIKARGE